jgi:Holliday junction resolvase
LNAKKQKGKAEELEFRDKLREAGFTHAFRSAQYCGTPLSPDVAVPELPFAQFEVKRTERCAPWDVSAWHEQAERDAGAEKMAIVAHRRSRKPWLVTMSLESFLLILRVADLEALNH